MSSGAEAYRGILTRVAPEASLLLGAGRAILLQLADPQIGTAVVRHSDFVHNPMKRLHNTLAYVYAVAVGTQSQRAAVIDYVNEAHAPVHAPRNTHSSTPAYSARDPRLQLWVAATLYDSAALVTGKTLKPLTAAAQEQLYREYVCLGQALQMPENLWPADSVAFDRYFESKLEELKVSPQVKQAADELFQGRHAPWWVRILLPLAREVTVALLPSPVRELYGYTLTRRTRVITTGLLALVRTANLIVPSYLRHAPMRWSLRRIDRGELG